jgi:hypothetical protein
MKPFFFCLASVLTAQVVLAQGTPVQRVGQCPTGTTTSGDVCVPKNSNQVFFNNGKTCPVSWVSSKAYCVRLHP